jgi:hypothetical protein
MYRMVTARFFLKLAAGTTWGNVDNAADWLSTFQGALPLG